MKRLDQGAAASPCQGRTMIDRATRHALRVPLRYRLAGQEDWSMGETINMSVSGLLFSSDQLLEIDDSLEITFQTNGPLLLERSTRRALVVRRTLNNWPETRLIFAARFCS
ncbi:MAG TPA: PilZ domain-containing protein [Verrucomicrobiae bacterium]|nr:PilZ domain-containing protein [Verrucomicrobiae bacterium]